LFDVFDKRRRKAALSFAEHAGNPLQYCENRLTRGFQPCYKDHADFAAPLGQKMVSSGHIPRATQAAPAIPNVFKTLGG
jgi:hypothetical protein